jgi:oligopeptide/dipeptide ABC transporter ATP-binding protein
MTRNGEPLLRVADLRVRFEPSGAAVVDGASFEVRPGEVVGLVGESGCGKSLTALAILRLVPPPGRVAEGKVLFGGVDLLSLPEKEMRRRRGAEIAMVFQEPGASLNPVLSVGSQVAEVFALHRGLSRRAATREAVALLAKVGIPDAAARAGDAPHRLSGGQRQRAAIAMAIAGRPKLLLADEPTTALDVTVQAQILDLLRGLRDETRMAVLLITHNLGVVAQMADRVAVMYAGKVVETAPVRALFRRPLHPYTRGLFASLPDLRDPDKALVPIPGVVPRPEAMPSGCRFRDRCPLAGEVCAQDPPLVEREAGHAAACHMVEA